MGKAGHPHDVRELFDPVGLGQVGAPLSGDTHGQRFDTAHKARIEPLRLAHHLDPLEALQNLLPDDPKLQFGEPHADAAVDAEAERKMGARARRYRPPSPRAASP